MTGTGERLLKAISLADFGMHNYTERPPMLWWSFVLRVFDFGEGWLRPPQAPLQAGEPPAHHRRGFAPYGDCFAMLLSLLGFFCVGFNVLFFLE